MGTAIGQSIFMSDCSGFFSSIELNRVDAGAEATAQLTIYNGQTSIGEPRYHQTVYIPEGAGNFTLSLGGGTGELSFFEDSQYTFIITTSTVQFGASIDVDPYLDGQLFQDVGFINADDLWFRLNTTTTLSVDTISIDKIRLYPNPAQNSIQLEGINATQTFTIFNVLGVNVMQGSVEPNQSIDIQNLPSGVYLLKLADKETLRFVKR